MRSTRLFKRRSALPLMPVPCVRGGDTQTDRKIDRERGAV